MTYTTSTAYTVNAVGIRKAFRGKTVLDGVGLAVAPGQVVALLGPNGAGKTTLIRILATLLRPDAGTATVAGHDLGSGARSASPASTPPSTTC
jgi:ABC-2 type transport system ATP-binding protein